MSKKIPLPLLGLLMDNQIHSGEEIGALLGVSRAAVWKQLKKIHDLGLAVESLKGRGYRLIDSIDRLDSVYLNNYCMEHHGVRCDVLWEIDSTNTELLRLLQSPGLPSGSCITAESQTAGRGRRGKKWVSPFAKNLYFSMLWNFEHGVSGIEGLSLVVGISIAQVLRLLGLNDVELKWPNDILVGNKKLAGILVEVSGDLTGECHVVIGVGLNVHMRQTGGEVIDQQWTSLDQQIDLGISRTELLVRCIDRLYANLKEFQVSGFPGFIEEWVKFDAYKGRDIMVQSGTDLVLGVAEGVNNSGELLVSTVAGLKAFNSGEVSLRLNRDIGN